MLKLPRFGNINLHGSLLPKYRGAAPIQWAVANGETETGVTTMQLDAGLDTGDILLEHRVAIGPDTTASELYPAFASIGAELMIETLDGLEHEQLRRARRIISTQRLRQFSRVRMAAWSSTAEHLARSTTVGEDSPPGRARTRSSAASASSCIACTRLKRVSPHSHQVNSHSPVIFCSPAPPLEPSRSTKCRWKARRGCPVHSLRRTSSCATESVLPRPRHDDDTRPQRAKPAAQNQQAKTISPARSAAFRVLLQVETSSAHSDDLLHGEALRKLSQADRNLATALVMGVLRWQIALDAELAKLFDRPDQALPEEIRIALRMGAFQLRHMDRIPAHAALSESVELVRAAGHPKAAGLVNAILRKFSTQSGPRKPIAESIDTMSKRLGHPDWMVRRWETFYGRGAASAICEYDQHEPTRGQLFAHDQIAEEIDTNLIDDGSRLIAELAAASHPSPERIWDACAAPGGKTSVLARRHPGVDLLATDISAKRLQAMRRRIESELPQREIRTLESDATRLPTTEGNFDLILCDVPCSGTGTLARNPEIRHRLQPSEFERQATRQREILSAALARLRPGGSLLYSTCSLEPEENEEVVESVLAQSETQSKLQLISIAELLERLRSGGVIRDNADHLQQLVRGNMLRTLPGANFHGDGFFAAAFAREA